MVNNYSVSKKKRSKDVYSDLGKIGNRPDRAVDVYTNTIKSIYKDSFCIIGGIESSLRRFAHYDYWKDEVLPSIMISSNADLLIYGMGENPIKDILTKLDKGIPINKIKDVRGTMYKLDNVDNLKDYIQIPSYNDVLKDKVIYAKAHMQVLDNNDDVYGSVLVQKYDNCYVVQNKTALPLTEKEMDIIYNLPYERTFHPSYSYVPAIEEVEFSITSCRGCFGGCNYCALTYHQGRKIQTRSDDNIVKEANILTNKTNFKGYINDVGGPTANFREVACDKQNKSGVCKDKQCLFPTPCKNLNVSHKKYLELLRKLRSLEKVKKVFIRSGIRYDYVLADKDETFLNELCKYHVSGQLKLAPEHSESKVLKLMGKPDFSVYKEFVNKFKEINKKIGKEQYIVPYYISSHPGCTLKDAVKLSEYLNSIGYMPEQVQDFYPTPATVSTCMYYTELNPRNLEKVYVPKTEQEKRMQRCLLQYRKKENYDIVKEALIKADRLDLIGFESKCLIKPKKEEIYKINNLKKESENIKKIKNKKSKRTIRNVHKKKVK
jgi:uncharacterized radical SAM protein YgiQ